MSPLSQTTSPEPEMVCREAIEQRRGARFDPSERSVYTLRAGLAEHDGNRERKFAIASRLVAVATFEGPIRIWGGFRIFGIA